MPRKPNPFAGDYDASTDPNYQVPKSTTAYSNPPLKPQSATSQLAHLQMFFSSIEPRQASKVKAQNRLGFASDYDASTDPNYLAKPAANRK